MIKRLVLAAALIFTCSLFISEVHAQYSRGTVHEGLTIDSKILNKQVRYTIYLPYDYNTSERFYPVVYLLHGRTDNDMAWIQFGEANLIADKAISMNTIPAMILVTPDAGLSFYINNYDNSVRYEDFFINEFIPYIESKYRIRTEKQYRAISGLSMGGFGSLVYALKYPDLFSTCAAFSSAIYTDEEVINEDDKKWENEKSILYGTGLKGKARLTALQQSYNPINIVKNSNKEEINKVRFYLDCGDDDFLYKGNDAFHTLLRDLEIPHEFRIRDGGHQWTYWRTGLLEALKFIGTSFHQQ